MKRFQVEKTQTGYLAKKRKRPVTQRQYYDQGVPSNVLLPPRTLYAQNILDSHGTSFFDTFSYLNFMKDYFKQNQLTTPSFTDPNSLWGKLTNWYRKRNERNARIEEMERKFDKMSSKEIDDELKMAKAKREELIKNRKEEGDYEKELSELDDRIRALEKNDENRPFYKKLWDEITNTRGWSYDELDPLWAPSRDVSPNPDDEKETTQKTQPPIDENKDSSPVKVETPALTQEIEKGQTHRINGTPPDEEEREAAEKIFKRLVAIRKRYDELFNGGNPDPKDFDERRELIKERLELLDREIDLNRRDKTVRARTLAEIKKSHPEWLQGLYPEEVGKETTLSVAMVPPRRSDENTGAEMVEQVLKEAEDPAKQEESRMLMEPYMHIPSPGKRDKAGILDALSKALGSQLWNEKGRQELEKALKKGKTPDYITVRDEKGITTTFNFDDILEKGMNGRRGAMIETKIKEAKPRDEKTRKALEDVMGDRRFSKATRKAVLERDQKKRDKLIRDFRLWR